MRRWCKRYTLRWATQLWTVNEWVFDMYVINNGNIQSAINSCLFLCRRSSKQHRCIASLRNATDWFSSFCICIFMGQLWPYEVTLYEQACIPYICALIPGRYSIQDLLTAVARLTKKVAPVFQPIKDWGLSWTWYTQLNCCFKAVKKIWYESRSAEKY